LNANDLVRFVLRLKIMVFYLTYNQCFINKGNLFYNKIVDLCQLLQQLFYPPNMINEIIETDKYIMKIHDRNRLLEYIVKEGVKLGVKDLLEGKKRLMELRPGVKFFVLAEGVEFFTISREAREMSATREYSDNTVAIAFYTTNISVLLMGEMYNKISKPVVPTKIFNDRDAAKEWLREQMRKTKK